MARLSDSRQFLLFAAVTMLTVRRNKKACHYVRYDNRNAVVDTPVIGKCARYLWVR